MIEQQEKTIERRPRVGYTPECNQRARRVANRDASASSAGIRESEEDETFWQRNRAGIIFFVVLLAGLGWLILSKPLGGSSTPPRKAPEMQMVRIQLPPPLPPPPKIQPPPPKDEKQPEQAPLAAPDKKPEAAKPKPEDKPPEGLGTNIKGPGGNGDLSAGGGNGVIGGTGTGGRGGSMGAWYAGQVQTAVTEALRNNKKTRNASIKGLKFSVALDGTGRIIKANLNSSSGDPALDEAIRNEILVGLRLREPPPGGKPMSITMVLNARRPN